jgi:hypothetical protein
MLLETMTVNGVPRAEGTALVGFTTQFEGAPLPQLRVAALLYPFIAVTEPLKVTGVLIDADKDGFTMLRA